MLVRLDLVVHVASPKASLITKLVVSHLHRGLSNSIYATKTETLNSSSATETN